MASITKVVVAIAMIAAFVGMASATVNMARIATFDNGDDNVITTKDYFEPVYTYNDTTKGVNIMVGPRMSKLFVAFVDAKRGDNDGNFMTFTSFDPKVTYSIYIADGRDNSAVIIIGKNVEDVKDVASRITLL
jgi:hypothetical protein